MLGVFTCTGIQAAQSENQAARSETACLYSEQAEKCVARLLQQNVSRTASRVALLNTELADLKDLYSTQKERPPMRFERNSGGPIMTRRILLLILKAAS